MLQNIVMKFYSAFIFLIVFSVAGFCQNYSAATYNVRLNLESDGINRWDHRKEWLADQLQRYSPDIIGTQEGLHNQITYLDSTLASYDYVGVGRKDGIHAGEYAAIFFNTEKFINIDQGTFWLSATPDSVSIGWDAANIRICSYTLLFDPSNNTHLWVFNAHLDHVGTESRIESLKLIRSYIQKLNTKNYPVLLMGDFNAEPDSKPILYLTEYLSDARTVSSTPPIGPEGTFNGFDVSHPLDRRIDYIFVSKNIEIRKYTVINEIKDNRTPSDHLPVIVNFSLLKSKK